MLYVHGYLPLVRYVTQLIVCSLLTFIHIDSFEYVSA